MKHTTVIERWETPPASHASAYARVVKDSTVNTFSLLVGQSGSGPNVKSLEMCAITRIELADIRDMLDEVLDDTRIMS